MSTPVRTFPSTVIDEDRFLFSPDYSWLVAPADFFFFVLYPTREPVRLATYKILSLFRLGFIANKTTLFNFVCSLLGRTAI